MLKKLHAVPNFTKSFPHMMQELEKGKIYRWNNQGQSAELTADDIAHIEQLETRLKPYDVKVYAVLDNVLKIGYGDVVHMLSYLYVSNEDCDISEYDSNTFYAIADVVNTSWDINEMGSVLIQSYPTGGPIRVG